MMVSQGREAALALAMAAAVAAPFEALAAPTAVATFESLGLSWSPSGGATSREVAVQYRRVGEDTWRIGFPLWFDARNAEYRGSVVGLTAGTPYEVSLTLAAGGPTESVTASTWSEVFPVAETIELPTASSEALVISQSGSASGYILYTAAAGSTATIDVRGASPLNVQIQASYVILRGLTLANAGQHAINIEGDVHDIVIEDCDISGWGRLDTDAGTLGSTSTNWGINGDAGIHSSSTTPERIIIQRNRIHHPRSDANSWDEYRAKYSSYHPRGPSGIHLVDSAGNHVIRYNEIFSDANHRFTDIVSGNNNFSTTGFPNRDSDIYGNFLRDGWDDGIEAEGGNRNVRVWGNYIENSYVKIAIAATAVGPLYVWRNVAGEARRNDTDPWDSVERGGFLKTSDAAPAGGRIYVFHNTILQPPTPPPALYPGGCDLGLGHAGDMVNLVSRNNILHIAKDWHDSISDQTSDPSDDYDFDLYNGVINAAAGGEGHGIVGVPRYAAANTAGQWALEATSPGHDAGLLLPNFNDGFAGAAPDVGAFEVGSPPMALGVNAHRAPGSAPLKLNAGGPAVAPFVADIGYFRGTPFSNWDGAIDTTGVANAAPAALYRTERFGATTYTIPGLTAGVEYDVRLHFCENYEPSAAERRFDVAVNGAVRLTNYSISAAAGAVHRAVVEELRVAADAEGRLLLAFLPLAEHPLVNGIEVLATEAACACAPRLERCVEGVCVATGKIEVAPASCACDGSGVAGLVGSAGLALMIAGRARWRRRLGERGAAAAAGSDESATPDPREE